ncbi:hypothetical protein EYR38_003547 [Pleurotus pulmonarius]|nr:hypothetical protein EYR38_003547 [Pleurotus pulmonarius]
MSPTMPPTLMSPTAPSSASASAPGDLHSLNNRLIQVETTLTSMTSGSSTPFVSSYPPASGSTGLSSPDTAKANQPTQPTPGPSNYNKQSSVCHSNIPTSQAPMYHAIFKGDRSALTIPLPTITNTFLSGAFQLHSPSELEQEELLTLQTLGVDLTASSNKGKAPTKMNYQTVESFETTGMNTHKGMESVKLEPTFVSLQHHTGTHPGAVALPLNTPNDPTTSSNNSSAHSYPAPTSLPFIPQSYHNAPEAGSFRNPTDVNAEQERSLLGRNGLPPLSAYLIPSRPSASYEHVFSSSAHTPAPDESWGPASHHGVTSTVLSYLPHDWDEIKQLVANVEHFERNTGVCEDRRYLEQRIRSMVDGTTSADGRPLSLSFFASACALLALGSELRRQSTLNHHEGSQMVVDSDMSDPGKGDRGPDPRQWMNNPNFVAHRSFGTSAHTTSSTLLSQTYTSSPTFNTYPPASRSSGRAIIDPTLLYDLSVQALSLADSESQLQPADIDYVQACLWQVKYLFASDRLRSPPRKEGTGTLALPLVGKMVNVARQIDLGSDPDDDELDSTGRSSSRPQPVDNDAELEIEIEKNRRRRVWWEVVYYDLFISDSMNHPPLIAPAHIPMPPPSIHPPTPLREYLTDRQLDPTSLLYDTSAPYTTLLPNFLNDGADIMSEFELRCRLAQLVKLIQARLSSGRGYSFEQLASYETDLRTTLDAFREDWSSGEDVESTANNVNPDGASQIGVRPTDLSKAEATLIINKLIIKLYMPFIRPRAQPAGDAPERSSARPVLHQAIYGLVNAAHGLLTAAQAMVSLISSNPSLSPRIVLDFYNFGRFVFDATAACAYAHSTQPTAMWASQAKEDVATGAHLIDSESIKESWRPVDGMQTRTVLPTSLNWTDARIILHALRKNCCAVRGLSSPAHDSPAVCGSKRKLAETQPRSEERVQDEVEREERNVRHEHQLSNDRSMPVASNPYPLGGVPAPHDYDTPQSANDPPPQDPLPSVRGKRRLSASTSIPSGTTPNTGGQKAKIRASKQKVVIRPRYYGVNPTAVNSASGPQGVRSKSRPAPFFDGNADEVLIPPPLHNGDDDDDYPPIDSHRSRSSSLMQDGLQHPSPQHRLDSPGTCPPQDASARVRRPSDHDASVVSDVPMLYGASPTSYDSPYDASRGSVDAEVYGSSSSPYGNTTSSSGPLSAASSPYTQTSGQSHNTFNPSPSQRSPAFEPSPHPPAEATAYYAAPNPAPYESQYDSSHMRHGGTPMEYSAPHPGHYGMKVGNGPPPPQIHAMSVQAPQQRSYGQQQVMHTAQPSQWPVNSIQDMGIPPQAPSQYGWQDPGYY